MQGLVAHVLGMTGGEADTHLRDRSGHPLQQLWETGLLPLGICGPIAVDILSQESHLPESSVPQVHAFAQDTLHVPAPLPSARVGYYTIMAEVVASAHDAYKSAYVCTANTLGHHIAVGLGERQFHIDGFLSAFHLCHQVGQGHIGIRASHKVHMMLLDELIPDTLGHTAKHTYDNLVSLLLQTVEKLQSAQYLLLSIISHRACVQENGIGLLYILANFISRHPHHAGHHLTVCHIHLAAIGFYQEFLHCTISPISMQR